MRDAAGVVLNVERHVSQRILNSKVEHDMLSAYEEPHNRVRET